MSIKSTIAALAASPFVFAGAAFAGPYVNVESNLSYPDGDYSAATTDLAGQWPVWIQIIHLKTSLTP